MANEEHVAILKQGVTVWDKWRKKNRSVKPDLSGANLSYMYLVRNEDERLREAKATARYTISDWATREHFRNYTKYLKPIVEEIIDDVPGTNFMDTNLTGTNLTKANLTRANLVGANLTKAILHDADFSHVAIGRTVMGDVDLSHIKGLITIKHNSHSTIGIDTIYRSGGNIPEVFLRGAGVPDTFIAFMKSLTSQAIDFYSCFISHSSKDKEFAERLYADLQSNSVRCWYAPHHMEIGAPILNEIDSAIRLHDKLLLILSQNSVGSRWVEHEVLSATSKEYQQERDTKTLFPIRLDDTVMGTNVQWARNLKETRHIADFTGWKDHDSYKVAFDRLLRDLKGKS